MRGAGKVGLCVPWHHVCWMHLYKRQLCPAVLMLKEARLFFLNVKLLLLPAKALGEQGGEIAQRLNKCKRFKHF